MKINATVGSAKRMFEKLGFQQDRHYIGFLVWGGGGWRLVAVPGVAGSLCEVSFTLFVNDIELVNFENCLTTKESKKYC